MKPMDEPSRRRQLADRYLDYPLISMFILSPAFPLTIAGLILLGILIGLCIPKLWVTSPPDFSPKIKVSAIDLAQAAILRHRARKLESEGKFEEAHYLWQSAVANNQGDASLVAAALTNFIRIQNPPQQMINAAIDQGFWLLRLTRTNDLARAVAGAVFVRCRVPEFTYGLLQSLRPPLPPAQETAMLKALFLTGRIGEYRDRRDKFRQVLPPDRELDICDAAYMVEWGPADKAAEARKLLAKAIEDRNLQEFACRVQMVVAAKVQDPVRYEYALERLRQIQADTAADNIGYWKVLEAAGRLADARRLAESYPNPPTTPAEVIQFSSALISLGATDQAEKLFARYAPAFANTDNVDVAAIWVRYAELLVQSRKWDALQTLAVQLRTLSPIRTMLTGYSYFLEGRAALSRGRTEEAAANFKKCVEEPFYVPAAGMHAASDLLLLGHADFADRIIGQLEQFFANDVRYWQLVFDISYALKQDETRLLRAATRARELDPNKLIYNVNYAAALLICRQNPAEAAKITLSFFQSYPDSIIAVVNHCFALALNKRFDEAADILKKVNLAALGRFESTICHLCWLEIHFGRGELDSARADLKHIDTKLLFPCQVKWIESVRSQIESGR